MQQPRKYYGGFNYRTAFGDNPWLRPSQRVSQWTRQMGNSLFGSPSSSSHGGGSSYGSYGTNVARPDDRAVRDYMSHVLGGQRNQLRDYVRQAAGAGIKRGGMNVVGGPAADSALHHAAMQNLARGYSDRFREAMNYNKYLQGQQYTQSRDAMRDLQNMLGMEQRYLSSQAGWRDRLGNLQRSDYQADLNWDRGAPDRDWTRRQRQWATEDRDRQLHEQKRARQQWRDFLQWSHNEPNQNKMYSTWARWRQEFPRMARAVGVVR